MLSPAHRPSIPSIRFMALSMNTMMNTVRGSQCVTTMKKPVERRRRDSLITHQLRPFSERLAAGHNNRTCFISCIYELKEDMGLLGSERLISDLVNQQHIRLAEPVEFSSEPVLLLRLHQFLHQIMARHVIVAVAGKTCLSAEREHEVRLADSRRAEKEHVVLPVDERE